jgi:hypothetical protein
MTRPMPVPPRRPATPPPPPRPKGRRRALIAVIGLLVLIGILIGLDRAAVAYAQNQIADQIKSHGFPKKPDVTVQGFPFLTQVISRNLDGVDIRSSGISEGPITLSLNALATGIKLNSSYKAGTISNVKGTGLIAFSSIASAAGAEGAPGLKVSRAGPHSIKLKADLEIIQASAVASVIRTGPDTFKIHVTSTDGLPASLLGPVSNFTVNVPTLPLGLRIEGVTVSGQGVVIRVTGHDVSFGS